MLKFLGRGSAFNPKEGNNAAFIKENGTLLLLDCGSNIFERIMAARLLDGVDKTYVAITHRHPDHIGSLGDLIFYSYYMLGKKVSIVNCDNYLAQFLLLNGIDDSIYSKGYGHIKELNLNVEFNLTRHSDALTGSKSDNKQESGPLTEFNCYSLHILYKGKRIYYSGDSCELNSELAQALENGELDLIYHDCCSYDYEGNTHLSYKKLLSCIKKELRHKVYIMHIDDAFDIEQARTDGFKVVEIIDVFKI